MKKDNVTVSELADKTRNKYFPIHYKGYVIEEAPREIFSKEQNKIFSKVFPPSGVSYVPSKEESKKLDPCFLEYRKIHSERFLIRHKGKVVGWFQGEMEDFETFYMRNTGILPAHQNKGVYKKFLSVLETYIFKLGYARISSQHAPHNSRVLIVKLREGFIIVGQETHERWGVLIKLVKFASKKRRDYYIKRVD